MRLCFRRTVEMSVSQSKNTVRSLYPFNTKWFWITVLFMMPVWAAWLFLHFASFAIVNGTIAALGPIIVCLLACIRQKDWRFIALALGYALFIYWQGRGWLW